MNEKLQRTKERMIRAIKNYINERFDDMTYDEFDALRADDAATSVRDEALSYFELNCDEFFELTEYCNAAFNNVYEKYYKHFENFSNEHKQLLQRMADAIMYNFAESVTAERYDDQDEWIQFLQNVVCINWQEMQYINTLWTDEAKAKYRKQ